MTARLVRNEQENAFHGFRAAPDGQLARSRCGNSGDGDAEFNAGLDLAFKSSA